MVSCLIVCVVLLLSAHLAPLPFAAVATGGLHDSGVRVGIAVVASGAWRTLHQGASESDPPPPEVRLVWCVNRTTLRLPCFFPCGFATTGAMAANRRTAGDVQPGREGAPPPPPSPLTAPPGSAGSAGLFSDHLSAAGWKKRMGAASKSGDLPAVRELLAQAPDGVSRPLNKSSATALHVASQHGRRQVVEELLSRGADADARAQDSWRPIHMAAAGGHEGVVSLLLGMGGADVDAAEEEGAFLVSTEFWMRVERAGSGGHAESGVWMSRH